MNDKDFLSLILSDPFFKRFYYRSLLDIAFCEKGYRYNSRMQTRHRRLIGHVEFPESLIRSNPKIPAPEIITDWSFFEDEMTTEDET